VEGTRTARTNDATKQRIVEAATNLFLTDGYQGVSLSRIASAVNISTPALYWHFASKDELFVATMEENLHRLVDHIRSSLGTGDSPEQQLRAYVAAHVRWQFDQDKASHIYATSFGFRELLGSLERPNRLRITKLMRSYLELVRDILRRGLEDSSFVVADVKVASFAITSLCDYAFAWHSPAGRTRDGTAGLYAELAARLVLATPGRSRDPGRLEPIVRATKTADELSSGNGTTRDRIITAARGLFLLQGYQGTSLNEISRKVGISAPAVYWHFDSKEELFIAAMKTALSESVAALASSIVRGDPALAQLRTYVSARVRSQLERPESAYTYAVFATFRQLLPTLSIAEQEAIRDLEGQHVELLQEILERGAADSSFTIDDPRAATSAILAICDYVFSWFESSGSLSKEQVAMQYSDMIENMVTAR
jgi:AcrR family transcriptional regulator